MNSTDLAHALAIPLDTPGCWGCSRCGFHNLASDCGYCDNNGEQPTGCLWPLPDSGEPGAELWTYWLMRALGWPEIVPSYKGGFEIIRTEWLTSEQSEASVMATGDTPQAALYAAWKEQK
jgi:hypothetical protein